MVLKILKPDVIIHVGREETETSYSVSSYRLNLFSNYKISSVDNGKALDLRNNCLSIVFTQHNFRAAGVRVNGMYHELSQPFVLDVTCGEDRLFIRNSDPTEFSFVPGMLAEKITSAIASCFSRPLIHTENLSLKGLLGFVQAFYNADAVVLPKGYLNTEIFTGPEKTLRYLDLFNLFFNQDIFLCHTSVSKSDLNKLIWKHGLLSTVKNNYKKGKLKVVLPEKFVYNLQQDGLVKKCEFSFLQVVFAMLRSRKF